MSQKQQLGRETIWGCFCWPTQRSHASITCSPRNPWWVSVGNTRQRHQTAEPCIVSCHSFCFWVNYAAVHAVTQEVKVYSTLLQCRPLAQETMAKLQSAFMVRIEDSWRPCHLLSLLASHLTAVWGFCMLRLSIVHRKSSSVFFFNYHYCIKDNAVFQKFQDKLKNISKSNLSSLGG